MNRLIIRVGLGRIFRSSFSSGIKFKFFNDLNFKTIRKDMEREFSASDIKTEKEGK